MHSTSFDKYVQQHNIRTVTCVTVESFSLPRGQWSIELTVLQTIALHNCIVRVLAIVVVRLFVHARVFNRII